MAVGTLPVWNAGVFKLDWALDAPIPFVAAGCKEAGTVHIGNTFAEIAKGEQQIWNGKIPEKPFVLLAQPSYFGCFAVRPTGKTYSMGLLPRPLWINALDMTTSIENQVERFAPGFKDIILARHTMNTAQMEEYNPNYIGGDINGGGN